MRCNDFDAHIDEMLSGILYPDANQHMRQCERCTSHYRARASVQSRLRKLAAASPTGPSRATDCAVMDAFRKLQQRRAGVAETAPVARMFSFPSRDLAPAWASRTWWSGAAAAGLLLAVMGSTFHLWYGVPNVEAPTIATAPSADTAVQQAALASTPVVAASSGTRRQSTRRGQVSARASAAFSELASAARTLEARTAREEPRLEAKASPARAVIAYEGSNYDSTPVTQLSSSAPSVIHLASTAAANNVAQSASSTWPGYSNLMYCDPVVCSGPMQVVHIRVPVNQVRPNLGQSVGNAFVNAEVVVGPDGVARAIRVAN